MSKYYDECGGIIFFIAFACALALSAGYASADEVERALQTEGSKFSLEIQSIYGESLESTELNDKQVERYKRLMSNEGWPRVADVGPDVVQKVAELLLKVPNDYQFQMEVLDSAEGRIDIDVDALAFARLSDLVKQRHDGGQRFGTLQAVVAGKIVVCPEIKGQAGARFFRDFQGLLSVQEELALKQRRLDAGEHLELDRGLLKISRAPTTFANPDLRERLGVMIAADQQARGKVLSAKGAERERLNDEVREIDRRNGVVLRDIFSEWGFPDVKMVGRAGVSTVFLLVQHADDDLPLQKKALELAKPLVDSRQMSRQQYAMLVDRVRLSEGLTQLYGTQTQLIDGKVKLKPVDSPASLDARRSAMAMGPIMEYLASLQEFVDAKQSR